jgi:hypothetical protein
MTLMKVAQVKGYTEPWNCQRNRPSRLPLAFDRPFLIWRLSYKGTGPGTVPEFLRHFNFHTHWRTSSLYSLDFIASSILQLHNVGAY